MNPNLYTYDVDVDGLDGLEIGPTDTELQAIELEMPLIEAEMDVTYAVARLLTDDVPTSDENWRRLRRAQNRKLRALVELLDLTAAALGSATSQNILEFLNGCGGLDSLSGVGGLVNRDKAVTR